MASRSRSEREIEIPPCANRLRRNKAVKAGLERWLRVYLPESFPLPFSADHKQDLATMDRAIKRGGLFAQACPRGDGKTTRTEGATLYAVLNGYRSFVVPIGADAAAANEMMDSIKSELESNELLLADYPEACVPIAALEGVATRGKLQRDKKTGLPTSITWKANKIILPTVKGSKASGAIICPRGLTGRLRGLSHKLNDGRKIRPDLVLIDDPQTRESASSAGQCDTREQIIIGDVLGLAGHKRQIAGVANITVIKHGDLAHRLLDHKRHPEFQGVVRKLVIRFPDAQDTLWKDYAEIRQRGLLDGDNGEAATAYYLEHRQEMDAGAVMAWPEQFADSEHSALQHAENLLIDRGEEVFWAEFQNEPRKLDAGLYELKADTVCSRLSGLGKWVAGDSYEWITAFIDCGDRGLWWTVTAWRPDSAGQVLGYGRYPETGALWSEKDPKGKTEDQALFEALWVVSRKLAEQEITRRGHRVKIDAAMVDCGWKMGTVFEFCKQPLPLALLPSRGRAADRYNTKGAIKSGDGWSLAHWDQYNGRVLIHNSDYWRKQCQQAFFLSPGTPGGICLYGNDKLSHWQFGRHAAAQKLIDHFQGNTEKYVWGKAPGDEEDWMDCLVGCRVAASALGVNGLASVGMQPPPAPIAAKPRDRVTYVEI